MLLQLTNLQRALFHQVIGPCKPCSDPNLSVAEKGRHEVHVCTNTQSIAQDLKHTLIISSSPSVLTTPSSWSLDSGTREALPFLSAHVGSVMAPPVPPRNLAHGKTPLLVCVMLSVCAFGFWLVCLCKNVTFI